MQVTSILFVAILNVAVSATPVEVHPTHDVISANIGQDNTTDATPFPFEINEDNINILAAAFEWIDSIPDAVIASGPNTLTGWSKDHDFGDFNSSYTSAIQKRYHTDSQSVGLVERQAWWAVANCVAQITQAVLQYIPVARVLKIKEYIEDAGGVYKAAKAMLKAKKISDLEKVSEALWQLATELSGVGSVYGACFA